MGSAIRPLTLQFMKHHPVPQGDRQTIGMMNRGGVL
jgi:hypothetical protein